MKRRIIFGAGHIGKIAVRYYGFHAIHCFADNDKEKQGTKQFGLPVISFPELQEIHQDYTVTVASTYCADICFSLKESGIPYEVFHLQQFLNIDFRQVSEGNKKCALPEELFFLVMQSEEEDYIENGLLIKKYAQNYMDMWRYFLYNNPGVWYICESIYHGHKKSLYEYCGLPAQTWSDISGVTILHGEAYGKRDCVLNLANYVCFSDNMRDEIHLSMPFVPALPIGAYIRYAKPYYDEQQTENYRKQVGRNLLVFPGHSIYKSDVRFDEDDFLNFVFNESKDFDTVTAVIYFEDINNPFVEKFIANGGRIACAGLKTDSNFLSRLRTLIENAAGVLTNNIGTHISHSLALNVPVKFYEQPYSRTLKSDFGVQSEDKTPRELSSVLMNDQYVITPQILEAYEPYLGSNYFRSPEELRAYFEVCDEIMITAKQKVGGIENAVETVFLNYSNNHEGASKIKYDMLLQARRNR